ncbi:hypothetical protein QBC37DRAFT_315755 [Rhypophila decipiens]|uniref:Late sexual development protein n=1 Tax=Rhypophila decipiens TaxID=261697 RepID=A0AAN7B7J3_9PEZI|nr:hypothetical protein QBC37DRAFT_315755 [Rhypophila decipiens]
MHLPVVISALTALGGLATAIPVVSSRDSHIDASDFPNPSADQLQTIFKVADGKLGNAPPPPKLDKGTLTALQFVAFNEQFEVAFFSSLVNNITHEVAGFEFENAKKKEELLDILETVLAQEKLHAINAANSLKKFETFVPQPCEYRFPSTTTKQAIQLAELFTALVLGTLQDVAFLAAKNGDAGTVRGVTSSLGQEGEQEGFYRILLSKKPSEKPFLTTNVLPFAFSALQQFVVPGSCPFPLKDIPLPIFPILNVLTGSGESAIESRDQYLTFKTDLSGVEAAKKYYNGNGEGLYITYFSGQLVPFSVPIQNVKWSGETVTFDALLPYAENQMDGLSVASLTTNNTFAAPGDVPNFTLAAPGLIQVADRTKAWDGI